MSSKDTLDNIVEKDNLADLSDGEKRLLYEAAVTGLSKIKQELEKKESPKPFFWRLLESSAGAALITVFIGGIFGTIISASIQQYTKQREFEQSFIKARHDRALLAFKDFSEKREEFIKNTLKIIAETIIASNDFANFYNSDNAPKEGETKETITTKNKLFDTITARHKTNSDNWQKEENIISDAIIYYFPESTEPSEIFQKTQVSMKKYLECVSSVTTHPQDTCNKGKEEITTNLQELNRSFGKTRTYEWKELIDPQKTKEFLDKISQVK
jgi:hypothetical protein